jgi:ethanolamine ammonia-lyase small subunit
MNEEQPIQPHQIQPDPWQSLNAYTQARIALGRTGISVPLKETLQFKLAHAHARDAVYSVLNTNKLITALQTFEHSPILLHSRVTNREQYLQRPDLGRRLNEASVKYLSEIPKQQTSVAIIIGDGLSADAIQKHALPVLQLLIQKFINAHISFTPICIVEQARVAIADEIASLLNAELSVILIGERPGLTSADSMGAYITYSPKIGLTDENRNCISNIRPEGLDYSTAAEKIFYLISESLRLKLSGVALKDDSRLLNL